MTKQEQIEEMAKIIFKKAFENYETSGSVEIDTEVRRHSYSAFLAYCEALYNAGYRKVPDGAVVLTKEDLILYAKDCIAGEITGLEIINALIERAKRKAAEARKESVKEFAEKMKEICVKKRQFIDLDDNDEEEYYFDGAATIDEIDKLLKEYEK